MGNSRCVAALIILSSLSVMLSVSAGQLQTAPDACKPCKATFNVNSTADAVDSNPGDGVCATSAHVCSLRAAVMEGNATPSNFMVQINVPAGAYTLTIAGADEFQSATGDLNIRRAMTISGAGSSATIIQGSAASASAATDGILEMGPVGATYFSVTLSDLQLRYGHRTGIYVGGNALTSSVDVSLNRCIVANNADNRFAIYGWHSPESPVPTLTLNSCTVTGNMGGAISVETANLVALNTTVNGNATVSARAGIFAYVNSTVTLTNCTISNNTATAPGSTGAITLGLVPGGPDTTSATLTNCTITGNTAESGASISAVGINNSATLLNVTSADNSRGVFAHGTVTLERQHPGR